MRVLKRGAQGADVRKLQTALKRAGWGLAVDGSFGQETELNVKAFQQKNGLDRDGIVGPKTWEALTDYLYDYEAIGKALVKWLAEVQDSETADKMMELID